MHLKILTNLSRQKLISNCSVDFLLKIVNKNFTVSYLSIKNIIFTIKTAQKPADFAVLVEKSNLNLLMILFHYFDVKNVKITDNLMKLEF